MKTLQLVKENNNNNPPTKVLKYIRDKIRIPLNKGCKTISCYNETVSHEDHFNSYMRRSLIE